MDNKINTKNMKTFPKLVIEEATNLKKYATPQEIEKLDIATLNSKITTECIYGQMTGYCHSKRAIKLIEQCAPRVYHAGDDEPGTSTELNGDPTTMKREEGHRILYWSPIEVFIDKGNHEANAKLVGFLKGEIGELV